MGLRLAGGGAIASGRGRGRRVIRGRDGRRSVLRLRVRLGERRGDADQKHEGQGVHSAGRGGHGGLEGVGVVGERESSYRRGGVQRGGLRGLIKRKG